MKKYLVILAIAAIACNDNSSTSIESDVKPADSGRTYNDHGYVAEYSSKFEMGDPAHSEIVLELWKDFDNNTLDNSRKHFADSVHMLFGDGSELNSTADSALASTKSYRGMMSEVKSTVVAIVPLKSVDKDQSFVSVWGKEYHTMNGKTDSMNIQEVWGFNKDNKITYMSQLTGKLPVQK